jgi:hypothetical protein
VVVALACVVALLVARRGTARARWIAATAMAGSVALVAARTLVDRRALSEPARILRRLARRVDPERSDKALRALSFVGAGGGLRVAGVSEELARFYVTQALAQLPSERIADRAARVAARVSAVALVAGVCILGVALANAWSVLEGADVLLARGGRAPVAMQWLDDLELTARPPDYLRQDEIHEPDPGALVLPYGTAITIRGSPMHPGRDLRLTDGAAEAPFVDDGAGAFVARWTLAQTTSLRVVARFGDVVVPESKAIAVTSVPDEVPVVQLEGAPRTLQLLEQTEDIPLRYVATDDHGLREVHLVLRSGVREERRVLARLDGQVRSEGGHLLKLRDGFLRRSHVPVEVTVEAKDDDPLTGPKWGASAAIVVVPPEVGEPEAQRLDALRMLRDALVDTLAWRLRNDVPADPMARKAFVMNEKVQAETNRGLLEAVLGEVHAGLRVPSRSRSMLVAQEQKTRKAVLAEAAAPSAVTHAAAVKATERFVLVTDAIVRGLGMRDTREGARQLADVADDLAWGAAESRDGDQAARSRGTARMAAATTVLTGGGRSLRRLGALGRDLGEIVEADLARVARARDAADLVHGELAARDLAARLRQPDPSFASSGGASRAGGESGGARGTPGDEGGEAPDDVEQAFNEAAQELERLAQDHAGEMGKMQQAMAGAMNEEELQQMQDEVKGHAEAIRQAAQDLPAVGTGSDSWTSKGAAAREQAEQMAHALESGRAEDAADSGRSALGFLDEGKKMLDGEQRVGRRFDSFLQDPNGAAQKRLQTAHRKLDAEQQWVQGWLEALRRRAAERARKQLEEGGEDEGKLADRARDLGDRGRDKGTLPQGAIESIEDAERAARQAADALRQGNADRGIERQREAQRNLEAASQSLQQGDEEDKSNRPEGSEGERGGEGGEFQLPKTNYRGPEEFRRRVMQGLAKPASGDLKDAVRRYAEGLLR